MTDIDAKRAELTERLRAKRAARAARGDKRAQLFIEAEKRAQVRQEQEIARERERLRRILGTPDGSAAGAPEAKRKRRPLTFTKRDLARAIEGHTAAGLSVQRTEIDMKSGKIVVVTGQSESVSITPANEWDSVK